MVGWLHEVIIQAYKYDFLALEFLWSTQVKPNKDFAGINASYVY